MGILSPVQELAWLVKGNLSAKHLVLSVEELFVHYIERPLREDETLVLDPMVSYHRMLLHRLADLFGLAHESVGEGDERHLVVEKCVESLIPAILVSDVLESEDEDLHTPQFSRQLLKRHPVPSDSIQGRTQVKSSGLTLEERQAAYLAARQRIFSEKYKHAENCSDELRKEPGQIRPRSDPVVARRMIAHALGKSMLLPVPSSPVEVGSSVVQPSERTVTSSGDAKQTSGEVRQAIELSSVNAAKRLFANALGLSATCGTDKTKVSSMSLSISRSRELSQKMISSPCSDVKNCQSESNLKNSVLAALPRSNKNARPEAAACRIFAHALGRHVSSQT